MRKSLIDNIDQYKNLNLTEQEKTQFAIGSSIGVPFNQLKSFLSAAPEDMRRFEENAPGVPADTSVDNPNNELAAWIRSARNTNPKLRICIKADGDASYPEIQKVIKTLEGWKIFKFNLITGLKAVPPGTAAYTMQQGGAAK